MDEPWTVVGVTPSRPRADEWAVVLAAVSIPHALHNHPDGWALVVSTPDAAAALEHLGAYDQENSAEQARRAARVESGPAATWTWDAAVVGVAVALLLIGFFAITGPRDGRSAWFAHGSADAARMVAGEWWRAVTALTLHADAPHVAGNAIAVALLMTAVGRRVGPGIGLWLLLLAGVGGNVLTAVAHGGGHISVGASTSTFGALGVLVGLQIVAPEHPRARTRKAWVIVAASLALLAVLGTGPNADLLAHAFGLLAGGVLGMIAALVLRISGPAPLQWLLVAAAGAAVLGAWRTG